ncbi:MAG: DegT/DnrJ/EryC1/StrS family aminotransferase [Hyphomicrobium sp.]|uniref:DegT/DnrJ/EryC1/StrS family aminotransferase n=1 Tax=Hyphomicrobium sp. TaxID=82 RepID=UPI0039E5A653
MKIIPQAAPGLRVTRHRAAVDSTIKRVLDNGTFILGPEVKAFETEFVQYLGTENCVGVSSGTDALVLALEALGVGVGDDVLVPAMTAPATAAAVLRLGARPRFVDVEPTSRAINPDLVARAVTPATKAIIVVHLHGMPAPVEEIAGLSKSLGLPLIEDCAQAHGTMVNGKKAGTIGDVAAFSFYPTKNLGCLGDGGCVVTKSAERAARLRRLRNYGFDEKGYCIEAGMNYRLDEAQAAVLRLFLGFLDADNRTRQDFAAFYDTLFLELPSMPRRSLPHRTDGNVYHQYAICTPDRDRLAKALQHNGVGTLVHYAIPLHKHPAFARASGQGEQSFPVAEYLAASLLSLPIQPELKVYQDEIGQALRAAFAFQS